MGHRTKCETQNNEISRRKQETTWVTGFGNEFLDTTLKAYQMSLI